MPNYNITIDSKFDPYSFEDYLKPLTILQEQHNQAADAYATALANSAGLYDALKANAEDAEAAKYVKDYENSLNALASDLATNGLNRSNRRGVYETKAKTGYIEKLKKAMDNRNTAIAQQTELINKDPSLVLSDYASNHGITRFLNPDFQYRSYSGNALRAQAAKLFEELSKSTYLDSNNPEYKRIAGLTMEMGIKAGLKPDDIQSAIDDIREHGMNGKSSKTTQILGNIAQGILISNLGERENNPYWSEDQWDTAMSGLMDESWHALGTEDFKTVNIDEPRATGSGSDNDAIVAIEPFMKHNLTPSGVGLEGKNSTQRAAISQAVDYLGGNVFNRKLPGVVRYEKLKDNFVNYLKTDEKYYKDGEFTTLGKQALQDVDDLASEMTGTYKWRLSKEEKEEYDKLHNKIRHQQDWEDEETDPEFREAYRRYKELYDKNVEANKKFNLFYNIEDIADPQLKNKIDIIKQKTRNGETLTREERDLAEQYKNNILGRDSKELNEKRERTLKIAQEAEKYYNKGAVRSDVIEITHYANSSTKQQIFNNIKSAIQFTQGQDYKGKNSSGKSLNEGEEYTYESYDDFKKEFLNEKTEELLPGVEIYLDIDKDKNVGYVFRKGDKTVYYRVNPDDIPSFNFNGMYNFVNSSNKLHDLNEAYNAFKNSDDYIVKDRIIKNKLKNGEQLTEDEREFKEQDIMFRNQIEMLKNETKLAGEFGYTQYHQQITGEVGPYQRGYKKDVVNIPEYGNI